MNIDRWQHIQEVFEQAIERDQGERESFLAAACIGDTQMRADVDRLLAQDAEAQGDRFLDSDTHAGPETAAEWDMAPRLPPGYQLLGVLGRGGMGVVYKARQTALNRVVALKMMLAGGHAGPTALARFRKEAEAACLEHPHIVRIYDFGQHEGLPYLCMEYVDGGNLAQKAAGKAQPPREAAQLIATLADAVQYAHERGVIHRDLKPANVLLTSAGEAKIGDFGLAKLVNAGSGQTHSGILLGTPSYMAPEQAAGKPADIGPGTDVYALGATFYELLTGAPPFRAGGALETLQQVVTLEPAPLSRLSSGIPSDLECICLRCLRKDPRDRYANAGELAVDLRRFLTGVPVGTARTASSGRLLEWLRRQWRPGVLSLVAVVLLTLLGGIVLYALDRDGVVSSEVKITRFRIPTANSYPEGITVGPDGNLWFTMHATNRIGRITPAGAIREFVLEVPTTAAIHTRGPFGITAGPDGNLWFAEGFGPRAGIGRISPKGKITEFQVLSRDSGGYNSITLGPDGRLWFTECNAAIIGCIDPESGKIKEFPIATTKSGLRQIVAGPDSNLWCVDCFANRIWRITPSGKITWVHVGNGLYSGITVGADKQLWFADQHNHICVLDPDTQAITKELDLAPAVCPWGAPTGFATGKDGTIWFGTVGDVIGRITPEGIITQFMVSGGAKTCPRQLVAGPDGNIWFTHSGNFIGRIDLQ
jgi:serine/threonine-protein kinase